MGVQFTKYCIEFYGPGVTKETLAHFESDKPFNDIHVDHLINPHGWPGVTGIRVGHRLRVVNVEHIISVNENIMTNKMMVYTLVADSMAKTIQEKMDMWPPSVHQDDEGGHA
ncbi:MAG: hypothetical protein H7829_07595 [Magnetococcus sp. THC-1_WYH]